MKLIDADQLNSYIVLYDGKFHRMVFQDDIDQLAESRKGKWIDGHCTFCGNYSRYETENFCPNCGARMEGVK